MLGTGSFKNLRYCRKREVLERILCNILTFYLTQNFILIFGLENKSDYGHIFLEQFKYSFLYYILRI